MLGEVVALLLLLLLLQGGGGECSERLWHCSRRRVLGEVVARDCSHPGEQSALPTLFI